MVHCRHRCIILGIKSQVFRTRSARRKEVRRVVPSFVRKEGRRIQESRRRGIRIQPPTARNGEPIVISKKPQQGNVLSFSQPPPLAAGSVGEEEVFLLLPFTSTSTGLGVPDVQQSTKPSSTHSTLSIEDQPTHTIASQSTHLKSQHSKQLQTSIQPEHFEVYDPTNTFKPASYPAKDTFRPLEKEDGFGDTAEAPQAEPLSLHQDGDEEVELSETERKQEEEKRRRGIEQWMSGRRGRSSTTSLLPSPIQIHEAVPSLEEPEDLELIDQIFDDAIFGASEVSEVKRKADGSVGVAQEEEEETLPEEMESEASDLTLDVFHQEPSDFGKHEAVWKKIQSKFEQLPPLYRSQIKYQPVKKASSQPSKKWQLSSKQKSLERKYSATPVPLTPLPTAAPHIQVEIRMIFLIIIHIILVTTVTIVTMSSPSPGPKHAQRSSPFT